MEKELKFSARALSPQEKETLRKKIVRLMKQHGDTKKVAEMCECSRRHVQNVWKIYNEEGVAGIKAKQTGRPKDSGALTWSQQATIARIIVDKNPNQLKLKGFLWDRANIKELIKRKFGVDLTLQAISNYTKKWGFTPQRPIIKNYKQQPEQVKQWLDEDYPAIAARAEEENAEIHWCDETGCQNESNYVRGYAPKGQTPVLPFGNEKLRVNMISSITNQGKLRFMFCRESIKKEQFLIFLKRLVKGSKRKIFLIVDNLKAHHAVIVQDWLREHKNEIELFFLPPYCPEYNPDEYLNGNLKREMAKKDCAKNEDQLESNARSIMKTLQNDSEHIKRLFHAKNVLYAA
jgi:transposase